MDGDRRAVSSMEDETMTDHTFPHERLDAWHAACRALVAVQAYLDTLPPGYGDERNQISRASRSVVRNLCEGAGRWQPGDKIRCFEIASGEACEAAGAVQVLLVLGVGDEKLGGDFLAAMRRTASMLTGLIQAQHRRRG